MIRRALLLVALVALAAGCPEPRGHSSTTRHSTHKPKKHPKHEHAHLHPHPISEHHHHPHPHPHLEGANGHHHPY